MPCPPSVSSVPRPRPSVWPASLSKHVASSPDCRCQSRIPTRSKGCAPPGARLPMRIMSLPTPIIWWKRSRLRAASSSPSRTRRSSRPGPTPSTRCSAGHSIRGTPRSLPAARRVVRQSLSPLAWRTSRKGRTSPVRSAIRRPSAASSACGRAPASSRKVPRACRTRCSRSSVPWRATSRMWVWG